MIWDGVYSNLHAIRKSILVISGDRDIVAPPHNVTIIEDAIPGAEPIVEEDSGHGMIFQEPVMIGERIARFLS